MELAAALVGIFLFWIMVSFIAYVLGKCDDAPQKLEEHFKDKWRHQKWERTIAKGVAERKRDDELAHRRRLELAQTRALIPQPLPPTKEELRQQRHQLMLDKEAELEEFREFLGIQLRADLATAEKFHDPMTREAAIRYAHRRYEEGLQKLL